MRLVFLSFLAFASLTLTAQPKNMPGPPLLQPHDPADILYSEFDALCNSLDEAMFEEHGIRLENWIEIPREKQPAQFSEKAEAMRLFLSENPHRLKVDVDNRQARRPVSFSLLDELYEYTPMKRMVTVLILEADHHYRHSRSVLGDEYLYSAAQLAGFNFQNPDLVTQMSGLACFTKLSEYMSTYMPQTFLRPEMTSWFPTWETQQRAMSQGLYVEVARGISLFENQGGLLPDQDWFGRLRYRTMAFFMLDKDETYGLMGQLLDEYLAFLNGPLEEGLSISSPQDEDGWIFSNKFGRQWFDISASSYPSFVYKAGALNVTRDLLDLHIALLNNEVEPTREAVETFVTQRGLINVFTGEPYEVDEAGRLVLLPQPGLEANIISNQVGTVTRPKLDELLAKP